mmetsp:Transcript_25120/g.73396  ORF Transcript_25120/g.73396 Transcript_25120/m.73396 type:complete len:279 (+) Transcript_25120:114-950(+)|eukprot:CAMPEP_0118998958 /NCGR_PEP_ID=MMETSP1173-20130426/63340_1 /TAXON_ID=1034831 /ORGANISM="Rhizochromulina marina cf, Strain CCMP1243" /LENGTH=278 /DNA_ID=CAMNT_0006950459 /DNA_START=35 /DNA_END=871 /DNA_ORIENTATION=-
MSGGVVGLPLVLQAPGLDGVRAAVYVCLAEAELRAVPCLSSDGMATAGKDCAWRDALNRRLALNTSPFRAQWRFSRARLGLVSDVGGEWDRLERVPTGCVATAAAAAATAAAAAAAPLFAALSTRRFGPRSGIWQWRVACQPGTAVVVGVCLPSLREDQPEPHLSTSACGLDLASGAAFDLGQVTPRPGERHLLLPEQRPFGFSFLCTMDTHRGCFSVEQATRTRPGQVAETTTRSEFSLGLQGCSVHAFVALGGPLGSTAEISCVFRHALNRAQEEE